jgi:hypothetical protein
MKKKSRRCRFRRAALPGDRYREILAKKKKKKKALVIYGAFTSRHQGCRRDRPRSSI